MNDSERKQHLLAFNPWWRSEGWQEKDPDLTEARTNGLVAYAPRPLAELTAGSLYLLLGPRRVGKSVAIKSAIKDLIEAGVDRRAITFCSCENLSQQDLRRLVKIAGDLTVGYEGDRYWFFDEITYVADWASTLKQLRDQTDLRHGVVVATGSSAIGLRGARGDLGGREGPNGGTRLLLPMGFRDFVRELYPELAAELPAKTLSLQDVQSTAGAQYFEPLAVFVDDLARAWERYLDIGGFPQAVADAKANIDVQPATAKGIWNILTGDVLRVGGMSDRDVKALMSKLIEGITSPLNVTSITSNLDIGGRNTVMNRIDRLCASFYMWRISVTHDGQAPVDGGQDKLYAIDPLISRLPSLRDKKIDPPNSTKMSEQQIGVAILHALLPDALDEILDEAALLVQRNPDSGSEIDFVGPLVPYPIESKYVSQNWKRERKALQSVYGRGLIATRDVLDTSERVWAIPSGAFAWAIGRQPA
jgi:predicted AAA+ superfamily ATPase